MKEKNHSNFTLKNMHGGGGVFILSIFMKILKYMLKRLESVQIFHPFLYLFIFYIFILKYLKYFHFLEYLNEFKG